MGEGRLPEKIAMKVFVMQIHHFDDIALYSFLNISCYKAMVGSLTMSITMANVV